MRSRGLFKSSDMMLSLRRASVSRGCAREHRSSEAMEWSPVVTAMASGVFLTSLKTLGSALMDSSRQTASSSQRCTALNSVELMRSSFSGAPSAPGHPSNVASALFKASALALFLASSRALPSLLAFPSSTSLPSAALSSRASISSVTLTTPSLARSASFGTFQTTLLATSSASFPAPDILLSKGSTHVPSCSLAVSFVLAFLRTFSSTFLRAASFACLARSSTSRLACSSASRLARS
mmetsp:Transcript_10219/g.28537  ORF Transcript_10219/g.28537 Transcript_10219/m.28537 type:complete len:238 (-) Transcript_10219:635-1348(-)